VTLYYTYGIMSPRRDSLPLLAVRPLRPRVGTLGYVISPLQGFTLLNVLLLFVAADVLIRRRLGMRMFTSDLPRQRFNAGNDCLSELKFLVLMGCGLAKSAATEIRTNESNEQNCNNETTKIRKNEQIRRNAKRAGDWNPREKRPCGVRGIGIRVRSARAACGGL